MSFKTSAAPGTDRLVGCPRCGDRLTVLSPAGAERCPGCGRVVWIPRLSAPRELDADAQRARLDRLASDARRGARSRRYGYFTLRELGLEGRPWKDTLGPLRAEVERCRDVLRAERAHGRAADEAERRFWEMALMRSIGEDVTSGDPNKRIAVLTEALFDVEDGGRRDILACHVARAYGELGELDEADTWVQHTEPFPEELAVHSERAATVASLALRRGDSARALLAVGERTGDVPIATEHGALAAQLRVAALEAEGRDDNAMAELELACRTWGQRLIIGWMTENELGLATVARFEAAGR